MMTLLAAAALYAKDAPESVRAPVVARFFDPRPGEAFELDPRDQRNFKAVTPTLKMRGFIKVTPPKGHCLTIKLADDLPDEVVCKARNLAFAVADLDRRGRLNWRVSTGDGDLGTDVSWPSPYRIAMVTPWDAAEDDPQVYRFIEACEPSAGEGGRKITLRLLGGEDWTIRFPRADEALPQPDATPNLYIYQSNEKISVKEAAHKDHESDHEAPEHDKAKEPPPPPPPKKGDGKTPEVPKDPNDSYNDRKAWAIGLRGAYTMSASAFQPRGSVAGGMEGRCRYTFDSGPDDRGVGRLECHDVDGFKSILLPLTCLKDIGPIKAQ